MDPRAPFGTDRDRGIAGLPIKLVVSFVVGTAVLGVMLHMVAGVGSLASSELDAKPTPDVVHPGVQTVDIAVVDASGHRVPDAAVVLTGDTAGVDGGGSVVGRTNASGVASVRVAATLPATRSQGTLSIHVEPPSGHYTDRRANAGVLVVR